MKIASLKFSDALDQLPAGEEYSGYNESTDIQPEELVQESPTVQKERRSLRRYRLDPQEGEMWYQVGLNQDMDVRPENERAITPYGQNRSANPKFSAKKKQKPSFYDVELDDLDGAVRYYDEKGQLHRLDGPALVATHDGHKEWRVNGKLHREDGPAIVHPGSYKAWYKYDKLHRLDGPAIEYVDGTKQWYVNGKFVGDSVDGFTDEDFNQWKKEHGFMKVASLKFSVKEKPLFYDINIDNAGDVSYYDEYGRFHRLDGLAIERANGTNEWYYNGKRHRLNGPAVEYLNDGKEWWVNNKLHRLDGPAIERANGDKEWWVNNKQHRPDGPAVEWVNGDKEWFVNGQLHRLDGPAVEKANGTKEWYVNNKLHRLDGPAIELSDGGKSWYVNGMHHRLDGPAIEWANGNKEWWVNNERIGISEKGFTQEDFERWKKDLISQ